MQRVQVIHPLPLETVAVAGIEYELDEHGRVEVADNMVPHFQALPHMFKIIGPDQVKTESALKGPRPTPTPKGLK